MSLERRSAVVRDLVEEAKKRLVILAICVVGLSYLMSLTSSSVWVNLPAAASLIIIFRYVSLDFEMRRKATAYNNRRAHGNFCAEKRPFEASKAVVEKGNWRRKVKSPVVEDAIDQFTRHLISEWVTNLWYSRLTPDKDGPEELVCIMNGVLAEVSYRAKNINLIDLLTRDVILLVSNHLELFRTCQAKIESQKMGKLTLDQRDKELKRILSANNKLHPFLFSAEAEHKVLQHLMDALISLTFNPEDLQCCFFRYIVRELLSCAVMRPVLNLATPRFINERIESVVLSIRTARKGVTVAHDTSLSKSSGPRKVSSDHFSRMLDSSVKGVELVQMKSMHSSDSPAKFEGNSENQVSFSKDPLLSVDPQSTRSWGSLPLNTPAGNGHNMQRSRSGGEWGDMLDYFSQRKTRALAPENFDNMWTKGKDYKNSETSARPQVPRLSAVRRDGTVNSSILLQNHNERDVLVKVNPSSRGAVPSGGKLRPEPKIMYNHANRNMSASMPLTSDEEEEDESNLMPSDESESESSSFYASEDEESSVTGLDTPTTKVWQGTSSRNPGLTHIRHPLESKDKKIARKNRKGKYEQLPRPPAGGQRSRLGGRKLPVWKEVERTSFLSGDGQDILNSLKQPVKDEDSSDDCEESFSRVQSGAAASSSAPSLVQSYSLSQKPSQTPFVGDAFFKLRCEVVGANIVKSCSKTFAVYSISVIDANNNSWSIKRRFRHFEELHRRLKEYPEYNLHLPPKHFLSTGLDVPVIQERCKLLHGYLKKLMQLPTVSGSIEVWDFLSVDSQTYMFSSAFSIVETLSVDLDNMHGSCARMVNFGEPGNDPFKYGKEYTKSGNRESVSCVNYDVNSDQLNLDGKRTINSPGENFGIKNKKPLEDSGSDSDRAQKNVYSDRDLAKTVKGKQAGDSLQKSELFVDAPSDPAFPTEWVPPNLSAPMLDLVDVVLQLHEGGWIRRKAFWVAKQVLQLGMGDALDDWLIEKIQLLRRGSVIASGIKRIEQILWPDGIFITKHPKRRRPSYSKTPSGSLPHNQLSSPKEEDIQKLEELQKQEAHRRANFVYELIIENAPSAVVSLVGRKEYEQCTKDLYFFLQSSVCLKQLALDLLELLLLSAFPEMNYALKQLHEEKHKFGEFRPD